MKKTDLTSRQREILDFIKSHIEACGYPPTVREIGAACRLRSPRSVFQHLCSLERKGYLRRRREKSRAIELLFAADSSGNEGTNDLPVTPAPILGEVPAGTPSLAVEERELAYQLDKKLFGEQEAFILRARGESMIGAHIIDGDLLVVRPKEHVQEGDIVVAMIGEEATVKRLVQDGERILLAPENNAMDAMELSPRDGDIRILGKVVGIIRRIK